MTSLPGLEARLYSTLPHQQTILLKEATRIANRLELPTYLVGGAVRDLFMKQPITDLDLVVEGDANLLANALATALGGEVLAHSQFGTTKLRVFGQSIDVVTARQESYRRPGALPTVHPGTIAQDLKRRDFTINAMAMRLGPGSIQLLDPTNGQGDITAGLVRILHPTSFQDDATRILRAIRYEQRLRFQLEQHTEALLSRHVEILNTISGDRLRRELDLIFREEHAGDILLRAANLGVLSTLNPYLPDALTLQDQLRRLSQEGGAILPQQYLALLAYSTKDDQRDGFIQRLNMTRTWARVVRDVSLARDAADFLAREPSPVMAYRLLNPLNLKAIRTVAALTQNKPARDSLSLYLRELQHVRPMLNGHDIANLGVPPGPQVGALLEALRDARLEGKVHTREHEEAFILTSLQGS